LFLEKVLSLFKLECTHLVFIIILFIPLREIAYIHLTILKFFSKKMWIQKRYHQQVAELEGQLLHSHQIQI